jgi:PAS domain S-box-containing protein
MADNRKSLDQLLLENEELRLRLTAKEALNETFRESENKYTAVYNSMSEGLAIHELIYDTSGKVIDYIITDVNPAYEQIIGLKKKKVVGRNATDVYNVSTAPYLDIYTDVALTGDPQTFETYFPPMDKHFQVSVFSPSKGKFATVFQDITERIRLEGERENLLHEIERQAAWLNASISSIATGIILYGLDGKAIHMNETAKKLLPEELFFNTNIEDRSKLINWETEEGKPFPVEEIPVKRAFNGETKHNVVLVGTFHDHKLWISVNAAPILAPDGKMMGVVASFLDITENKNAENILRKSEQRLKYHLENSPLAVVEWDKEFNIIQWSNEAERIFGMKREEVIGIRIDMLNIIYPEDIPLVEKTISKLTGGKELKVVSQNRNITKTGKVRECIWYNSVLLDEKGEMSSVMSLVEDITQLRQIESELMESRESYRELVSNARSMILKFDNEGRFTFINEFALDFFGYKEEELIGKSVMTIIPKTDSTGRDLNEMVDNIVKNPDNYSININENIKKNGEKVWVEWHNKTLFDQAGKKTGHIAIGIDISKRKKAEGALKESERKLRSVLDATQESIYMFDKEGMIVMSNATGIRRLKRKEENEVVVHHISEFMAPEIARKRLLKINEVFKSEIPLTYEDERESSAYQHNLFPVFKDDEVLYVVTYSTDITEQKRAEISLKQSEDRFRTIAESLTVIVSITKISDSTMTFLNEPFEKSFGYKKDEIFGTRMPDIYYYPDDNKFLVDSLKVKGLVENVEVRVKKRDGTLFWIMTSIRKINYMNEPSYLTASIDISETKKAQEELLRLNRTLDAQRKSSQAMMHSKNEQEYLNEICKIIIEDCGHAMIWVGYAQYDKLKSVKPVAHFGFDKGYIDKLNITWDDSDRGSGPTGTAIKTGKPSICRNMLTDPCFEPWREAAVKRGYASSAVLPLKSEGKAYGAISIYSKEFDPFTDSEIDLLTELADDLAYGILFIRLTEYEKEATRAIKENEIRLKELITTKDKFFNIIAHDLKNPFTSLLGASELLYDNITQMSGENVKKLALILNDSAKGGYSILQNLLDWSRSQTGQLRFNPENVNLKTIIDENIDNLQLQVNNKEINLKSDQGDDLFITADKNMINTVLRNLLSNAVKYTSKNGIIRVMVAQNKGKITLSVKDTGIGISKEKADSLFKLENSLSLPGTEKEQGTGLGLKLCKEFTEKMGGRIWVESKLGEGSEFKFTIPINGVTG